MRCTNCGSRFYSSAAEQMLADGATCECGGLLRAAPLADPTVQAVQPEGGAAGESPRG